MNFSDSAAFCASQGGKLASIDTEQNYFQTLASMGEVFANLNLARDLNMCYRLSSYVQKTKK